MTLNDYIALVKSVCNEPRLIEVIEDNYQKLFVFRNFVKNYEFFQKKIPNSMEVQQYSTLKKNTLYKIEKEKLPDSFHILIMNLLQASINNQDLITSKIIFLLNFKGVLFLIKDAHPSFIKPDEYGISFSLTDAYEEKKIIADEFQILYFFSSSLKEFTVQIKKDTQFQKNINANTSDLADLENLI